MKRVLCAVVLGGVAILGTGPAFATSGNPGGLCQAGYGAAAPYVEEFGTSNHSGVDQYFECPIAQGTVSGNQTVSSGWFNFLDVSTTNPLWCEMFLTSTSGGQWYSAIRYSCSQGGGCPDLTTSWTGYSWLGWSGSTLPTGGPFFLYGNSNAGYVCRVPPSSAGGAYVFAYGVN